MHNKAIENPFEAIKENKAILNDQMSK